MYINIETKQVVSHVQLQAIFPDTSFPPEGYIDNSAIAWTGYAVVELDPYPTLGNLQTTIPGIVREESGHFFQEWVVVYPTEDQWNTYQTEQLNAFLRQANSQVTALQGRIDMINDAIEFGEDEPEWAEELPVRALQLTAWKKYRISLNKVPLQATWAANPVWPTIPTPYTNETSAVTAPTV